MMKHDRKLQRFVHPRLVVKDILLLIKTETTSE